MTVSGTAAPRPKASSIIIRYATSSLIFQAMSILTMFAQARLLKPEELGLWNVLKLIPLYAGYIHLGMRDAMRYRIPHLQARGEDEQVGQVVGTVFLGALAPSLLISLVVVAWAVLDGSLGTIERFGLAATAAIVMLQCLYENRLGLLKATQGFAVLIGQQYLRGVLAFVLSIGLMLLFGVKGLMVSVALLYVLLLAYIRRRTGPPGGRGFSFGLAASLVRQGLPIMVFAVMIILMSTLSRAFISGYLGNEQLGYYSIGIMALTGLTLFSGAAREVIEPRLMQAGALDDPNVTNEYFLKPLINSAAYIPLLVGPVYLCTPAVITLLLPRYVPGIESARVICLGTYFLSLVYVFRGIIVARGLQFAALPWMAAGLAANLGLCLAVLEAGWGIEAVAISTVLSFLLLYILLAGFVYFRHTPRPAGWLRHLLGALLPFFGLLLLLASAEWAGSALPAASIPGAALRTAIFCLGALAMNLAINKAFPLADDVWTLLRTRGRG